MRKVNLTIVIVLLVIIGAIIFIAVSYSSPQTNIAQDKLNNSQINNTLIKEYIAQNPDSLIMERNESYNKELIQSISNGFLNYQEDLNLAPVDWQPRITCSDTNKTPEIKIISSQNGSHGIYGKESSIICGNNYWVIKDTNIGWFILNKTFNIENIK